MSPPERSLSPTLQSGRNTWVFFIHPEARRAVLTCWELLSKLHSGSQPPWGVLRLSSWEANESSKEPLENSPQNSHLLGGTRQRVPVTRPSEVSWVAADEGCPALLSRTQSKGKNCQTQLRCEQHRGPGTRHRQLQQTSKVLLLLLLQGSRNERKAHKDYHRKEDRRLEACRRKAVYTTSMGEAGTRHRSIKG